MVVKINTKKIGLNKPIGVHASLGVVDKVDEMMIEMLQLQSHIPQGDGQEGEEATIKYLQFERDFTQKCLVFLKDVLKLSDKQINVVKNTIEFKDLGTYIVYVCNRIKGIDAPIEGGKGPKVQKKVSADQSMN